MVDAYEHLQAFANVYKRFKGKGMLPSKGHLKQCSVIFRIPHFGQFVRTDKLG